MANVKMLSVLLEKKWSGFEAGETVTVEDYTAESMVRKGYGRIVNLKKSQPKVETADGRPVLSQSNSPASETAVITPQVSAKPQDEDEILLGKYADTTVNQLKRFTAQNGIDTTGFKVKLDYVKAVEKFKNQ